MESLEQRRLLAIDLVTEFIDSPSELRIGNSTEFRLRIANIGDEDAYDVLVEADLNSSLIDLVWRGPLPPEAAAADEGTTATGTIELIIDLRAGELADFLLQATPNLNIDSGEPSAPVELSASATTCFAKTSCPVPSIGTSITRLPNEGFVVNVSNEHTNPIAVDVSASLESIPDAIWTRHDAFQAVDVRQLDKDDGHVISYEGIRQGWSIPRSYLSSAGDLTGDGVDNLVYGGGDDNYPHVYVSSGAASNGTINIIPPTSIVDPSNNAIGDFNGDGVGDVIAATVTDSTIYLGGSNIGSGRGIPLAFEDSTTPMVRRTVGDGDLNGDGFDDFVLSDSNRTIVFFGHALDGTLDLNTLDQDLFFEIDDPLVSTGSMSGDVNGDGFDDLLFQIEGESSYHVIFGDADLNRVALIERQELDAEAGMQFATNYITPIESRRKVFENKNAAIVGDINADGFDDVVHTTTTGATLLFGRTDVGTNGFLPGVALTAERPLSVDKLGDFNGDGVHDVLLASPEDEPGAFVVFGGSLIDRRNEIDVRELNGLTGVQITGNSLPRGPQIFSNAGDLNSDGVQDLALSGVQLELNSTQLYIVYGKDLSQSGAGQLTDRQVQIEPNSSVQYIVQSETNGIGPNVPDLPLEVSVTPLIVDANDANNLANVRINIVSQYDLNSDDVISSIDFDILRANFGRNNATSSEGDLNQDGLVDFADFLLFRDRYNQAQ